MDLDWLKILAGPAAIIGAAALAWLTRRAERLKDAYADWAAAVFHVISARSEHEPPPTMSIGNYTPNPQWTEWNKAQRESLARLRSTIATLHTREPSRRLRDLIDELSGFGPDTDMSDRIKRVRQLIAEVAKESWLLLTKRHMDAAYEEGRHNEGQALVERRDAK